MKSRSCWTVVASSDCRRSTSRSTVPVEVVAVHDAVVRVGVADGNDHVDGGRAAVGELHFGGVVTVALDEVKLERDVFGCGCLFDESHDLAVGERAGVVEEDAGAAAECGLGFFGVAAGCVAGRCHLRGRCRCQA